MSIVYLGVGSNIGDKAANCEEAVRRLCDADDIEVIASSTFYQTLPVGGPPQENYLNGVLKIETKNPPETILSMLKSIEKDMGRKPAGKDHPRIIDIDILLYDKLVIKREGLVIPHPRMHERSFVLKGLAEIAPEVVHPEIGKTALELLREVNSEW